MSQFGPLWYRWMYANLEIGTERYQHVARGYDGMKGGDIQALGLPTYGPAMPQTMGDGKSSPGMDLRIAKARKFIEEWEREHGR